jgi:hypothetical protein
MLPKFSRALFKAWLQSKKPDEVVGNKCNCTRCPLAMYVRNAAPGGLVDVFVSDVLLCAKDKMIDTPLWAHKFIHSVDQLPGVVAVTAAQALEVLRTAR